MIGPTFDEKMRAEIRRKLKDYQERHGIGAPTLHQRIEEANPAGAAFTLKTLQRLLSNAHTTYDRVYHQCLLFLMAHEEEDLIMRLGDTFSGVFGMQPPEPGRAASKRYPSPVRTDLAGTYHVFVHGAIAQPGTPVPIEEDLTRRFDCGYSVMTFSSVPGLPWMRAVEYVGNPLRRPGRSSERAFEWVADTCYGALAVLQRPGTYLVGLRGFLFNHPKFYFLTDSNIGRGSPPVLDGQFLDREPHEAAESVFAAVRVLLRPQTAADGEQDKPSQ